MTKRILSILFFIVLIYSVTCNLFAYNRIKQLSYVEPIIVHDTILVDTLNVWEKLQLSLMKVESEYNPNAVNAESGAAGILQLMPIYVKEANRISGLNYTLEDRFDPNKSIEMFEIVQGHHNPEQNIIKAISLHNSPLWYRDRVLKTFETISLSN